MGWNMDNYTHDDVVDDLSVWIWKGLDTPNEKHRRIMSLEEFKLLFKSNMVNKIPINDFYNLLEISLLNNRTDITEYLLTFKGWNINHQNYDGLTILQYVSQNRFFNYKLALNLLNYDDDIRVNIIDRWGNNPLHTSVSNFFSPNVVGEKKLEYYQWIFALKRKGSVPNDLTMNFAISVIKDQRIIEILTD